MSNSIFYGGIPIEQVNFQEEATKELKILEQHITSIKEKLQNSEKDSYNFKYWAIKLHDANKRLEIGTVTLD